MTCKRCQADTTLARTGWCGDCELAFDAWNRRNASDIIVSVLGGMLAMISIGVVLPMLGFSWIVATGGAFAGFGSILATQRALGRRRRRQFLAGGAIPRAYLPAPK